MVQVWDQTLWEPGPEAPQLLLNLQSPFKRAFLRVSPPPVRPARTVATTGLRLSCQGGLGPGEETAGPGGGRPADRIRPGLREGNREGWS